MENPCGFEDSVTHHGSFAIPENVAQVYAITHLLKVFVRILSALRGEGCIRPPPVRPELSDGRATGKDHTELAFGHSEVV